MIFVDASAFFACLYGDDEDHPDAVSVWRELAESDVDLVTTNYVVVETLALIQRKAGAAVARTFLEEFLQAVVVIFVDERIHRPAEAVYLAANSRRLSLVDCVSFQVMRDLGIRTAFAFDRHFVQQGFRLARAPRAR